MTDFETIKLQTMPGQGQSVPPLARVSRFSACVLEAAISEALDRLPIGKTRAEIQETLAEIMLEFEAWDVEQAPSST